MTRAIAAVVFALAAAGGCKSQDPPAPMKCADILPAAIDRIMADHAGDPRVAAVIEKARTELVAACTVDKWPARVGECIAEAKDRAAMDQCRGGLGDKQRDKVKDINARLRGAIEQSGAKAPEPAVPAEATGSGSAAAAGSGSAAGSGK